MDIADFDYDLPESAIAQEPLRERDASRLMVLDRATGAIAHRRFADLPELLQPGDLLVRNRSRVFPARLIGRKPEGGRAEILLVRPLGDGVWSALVRPGRRLKPGARLLLAEGLSAVVGEPLAQAAGAPLREVVITAADGGDPSDRLTRIGHVPLPPYIRRSDHAADRNRYQTVYARESGSVAAPTAGLHFTRPLLHLLEARGIGLADVVLHVGPGTFQPVKTRTVEELVLAPEPFDLPSEAVQAIARTRAAGGKIVAVGTTTTRVLESALGPDGVLVPGGGETNLAITPGFRFRGIDALITNFHLPRSSLLLLVSAFAGRERLLAAYREALTSGYRFYSYGDAMLVL
jgi:S-adenosylmethionine:tRNA ribosyltransferase-isomerase